MGIVLSFDDDGGAHITNVKMPDNTTFDTNELAEAYLFATAKVTENSEIKEPIESYLNGTPEHGVCYYNEWRDNLDLANVLLSVEDLIAKRQGLHKPKQKTQRFASCRVSSNNISYQEFREKKAKEGE